MSKDTQYNILFSNDKDKRVNLFLHTVNAIVAEKNPKRYLGSLDEFTVKNPVFNLEGTKGIAKHMQSLFYDEPGTNGTYIHKEWGPAILDFILYVISITDFSIKKLNKIMEKSLKTDPDDYKTIADYHNASTNIDIDLDKVKKEPNTYMSIIKIRNTDVIKVLRNMKPMDGDKTMVVMRLVQAFYNLYDGTNEIKTLNGWDKINKIEFDKNVLKKLFGEDADIKELSDIILGDNKNLELPATDLENYKNLGKYIYNSLEKGTKTDQPSNRTTYTYRVGKFLNYISKEPDEESDFFVDLHGQSKRFVRINGVLHLVTDDNKFISIHDKAYHQELEKYKTGMCKSVGLKEGVDELKCDSFLIECLKGSGDSITKCKNYLQENIFSLDDDIRKMPVPIIMDTIKALKLVEIQEPDPELNITITKLDTWENWLKKIKEESGIEPPDYDKIKNNYSLEKYIRLFISNVNAQPAILNKNINASTIETVRSDTFKGSTLYKFGLQPNFPHKYKYLTATITLADVMRLHEELVSYQNNMRNILGIVRRTELTGGGINDIEEFNKEIDIKLSHGIFQDYIKKLNGMMKAQNKEISKKDMDAIYGQLDSLERAEKTLKRSVNYINSYVKSLSDLGENSEEQLTMSNLKLIVDKRNANFERTANKQLNTSAMTQALITAIYNL